jgi:rubredoxin
MNAANIEMTIKKEQERETQRRYPPGTPFESLPQEFTCPDCAVRYKEDFVLLES